MKKPLIALTPACDSTSSDLLMRPTYMRAIAAAGGLPIILPLETTREDLIQAVSTFDGFLFTGGPDVHPFHFQEETLHGCGSISELRDGMELELFKLAVRTNKPILGICRGIQVMNIAAGGDIYQDIHSQLQLEPKLAHQQGAPYSMPAHLVTITENTLIHQILGSARVRVNSMHHQTVRKVAPSFTAAGHSVDGLIEAIYMPDKEFVIGVQWHPEYLWEKDPAAARLFASFVRAAS